MCLGLGHVLGRACALHIISALEILFNTEKNLTRKISVLYFTDFSTHEIGMQWHNWQRFPFVVVLEVIMSPLIQRHLSWWKVDFFFPL